MTLSRNRLNPTRSVSVMVVGKSGSLDGSIVSETENTPSDADLIESICEGSFIVSETEIKAPATDYERSNNVNGLGVTETNNGLAEIDPEKPVCTDGIEVSDTDNEFNEIEIDKTVSRGSNRVSETGTRSLTLDPEKPVCPNGIKVSDTKARTLDSNNEKSIMENSIRVSDTRIDKLEALVASQSELLAGALRRIRFLEERVGPMIEKEDAKRNRAGLKKLRDSLEALLKKKYVKNRIDAVYVSDLYGPNGRKGGKLGISKMQAFRLRDACRTDDRFRVEKAENKSGKWLIRLNQRIK